jgi:hypothetical protein
MFESVGMLLGLCSTQLWLAQIPADPTVSLVANTPEQAALVFSGPQFFIALIAGVLMAFAFQFLLTNFTLAAGISAGENPLEAEEAETWGGRYSFGWKGGKRSDCQYGRGIGSCRSPRIEFGG